MRIATARTPEGERVVVHDKSGARILTCPSVSVALRDGLLTDPRSLAGAPVPDLDALDLAPAVHDPDKIFCVGHNYLGHLRELGHERPQYPTLFAKMRAALVGPHDEIELDGESKSWDWEAELAVVVGRPVRHADRDQALSAIAGYAVANDVTARDWQRRTSQFLAGKTFEHTCPLGPWIVSADELDPSDGLRITCAVDGRTVQDSSTADLIFDAGHLVSYLSSIVALTPGDVILTGTPSGVGAAADPPCWLNDGQVLTTSIEGIGTCENRCTVGSIERR